MGVRVRDHEWDGVALGSLEPLRDQLLCDRGGVARARAGIDQERALAAEEKVEEGLLVMRAAGFAEDVKVGIVLVNLPVGHFQAVGAASDPRGRKNALLDAGSGGEQGGCTSEYQQFGHD